MTKDLEYLVDTVVSASKIITDNFTIDPKGNYGDIVTTCDYEVEKYIISRLNQAYPDFNIVSEEYNSSKGLTENCFTIDPIDGTVNFAHGIPMWVIQVAMIKNNQPCASVIYAPRLNELYTADSTGAYLNNTPIKVSSLDFKDSVFTMDGKPGYPVLHEIRKHIPHTRIPGSAGLDFAFVSAGRSGATLFRSNNLWDYTPGLYLVQQAGGYIIDEPNMHIGASSKEIAELIKECCAITDSKNSK